MYKYCPFFLLLLLISCTKQAELTGHWHLNHGAEHSYISTLDFVSDTFFMYNQRFTRWEGPSGYLDQKAQTLYWGGECMMGDWSYESLSANKIKISDRRSGEYVGILTRNTTCRPPDDFFVGTRFNIQLPTFTHFNADIGPPALISDILAGPLKPDYQHIYPGKYQVALGDMIIHPDNETHLALFDEQHRVKLPETKHHLVKTLVYLDKDTPLSTLKPVLEHYAMVGRHDIYFAGLAGSGDSIQLVYRKMDACDLLEGIEASK